MSEIIQTIGRVRRAQPRNADVMAICDELERLLTVKAVQPDIVPVEKPKFDRTAYQRELMRKRRAAEKATK